MSKSRSLADLLAQLVSSTSEVSTRTDRDTSLRHITEAARNSLDKADAVSISVKEASSGFATVASTGELSSAGDEAQYELGEGPCLDAADGAPLIRSDDVTRDDRWPTYSQTAQRLGIRSQAAVRMFADERSYGGLNVYSRDDGAFGDDESVLMLQIFAGQAATVMGRSQLVEELTAAMQTRGTIGQAVGLLMERYQIDEKRAFGFLARLSSTSNTKLRDIAADIVRDANEKAKKAADQQL